MAANPNKLSQFWNELKRRKVFRVVAMYAASAFILLEVVDIIVPALLLPTWTVTLVVVLLAVGFPIVAILSWIFDITPEGVRKTDSIEVAKEQELSAEPVRRRLRASDVIIVVLVVVVGILAYPKIFKKDEFKNIRDEDGKISVAVMPFQNMTGDTLYNVWQGGFQNLLINTLSNSKELSVRQYQTIYSLIDNKRAVNYTSITPSIASELALKLETKTYIFGNILKSGKEIRVNAQLVDAETEEIYKTYQANWNTEDDVFTLVDSLGGLIKNHLEIKKLVEQYDTPVFKESVYTNSSEAYRYFIHGWDAFMGLDFQTAIEWLSKAIEADSNFISAYSTLSFTYLISGNDKLAKSWCNLVYKKRNELPVKEKLMLEHLHAYYYSFPDEEIKYLKQFLEIDELNPTYWYLLGLAYYQKLKNYEDAIINFEKALEIHRKWGSNYRNPWIYVCLGVSYHKINDHKKEKEIFEIGLSIFPEYTRIIQFQSICALSLGDMEKANDLIMKYKSINENSKQWPEARILSGVGYIYLGANLLDEAELHFRQALKLDPNNPSRLNDLAWFLINNDINIDEGMTLVQKALELRSDDWYFLDTKGWGLYKQGQYDKALKVLKGAWSLRRFYNPEGYQHIQEVEKAIARQN